jgi:hypothetical protein
MGVVSGLAVVVLGLVVTAWVSSRVRGSVLVVAVTNLPFLVLHRHLVVTEVVAPGIGFALLVAHLAAVWAAMSVGWIAASHRLMARGLDVPVGDAMLIPELVDLHRRVQSLGFEPVSNATLWSGDIQMTWLVHADGTVAELVCSPDLEPGFGLATMLSDSSWVMSSPYPHGTDRTKIRVPGASFEELLEHHRTGVSVRAAGRSVEIPDRDTLVAAMVDLERSEMREVFHRFWWNCSMAWFRQLVPSRWAQA